MLESSNRSTCELLQRQYFASGICISTLAILALLWCNNDVDQDCCIFQPRAAMNWIQEVLHKPSVSSVAKCSDKSWKSTILSERWSFFAAIHQYNAFKTVTDWQISKPNDVQPVVCLRGGERGTCLGLPLSGGPPLTCYVCKFSLFLMKNLSFTHIMYYKANHK